MSGDLGNLLTGELGEAEARFSHEDFAGDFGQRIARRVRRRRAVRAAGVGGGTMLTAGALVVGVTQVPWGTLGATPGVGARDCVTPSANDGWTSHSASIDTGGGSLVVFIDAASGSTIVRGVQQPEGTYLFTDGQGDPLSATPGVGGYYTVELPPGAFYDDVTRSISVEPGGVRTVFSQHATSTPSVVASPSDETATGNLSYTYTVEAPDGSASPSASEDCYTTSPAPSGEATASTDPSSTPEPSLAAKPEELDGSPFQCGFVMDSLSHESSQVAITGVDWVDPTDFNASLQARWPMSTTLPLERGTSPMPVAKVRVAQDLSVFAGGFGPGEPTDERAGTADGGPMVNTGASFVGVRDGVVVATADTATEAIDGENSHFVLDYDGTTDALTLVNASDAFIACPGQTFDPNTETIVAVAGSYVKDESGTYSTDVEYSWTALERN